MYICCFFCRLPVGTRIYSYFQSLANKLLPGVRTPVLAEGCQILPPNECEHAFSGAECQSLLKGKLQLTYLQSNAKYA